MALLEISIRISEALEMRRFFETPLYLVWYYAITTQDMWNTLKKCRNEAYEDLWNA